MNKKFPDKKIMGISYEFLEDILSGDYTKEEIGTLLYELAEYEMYGVYNQGIHDRALRKLYQSEVCNMDRMVPSWINSRLKGCKGGLGNGNRSEAEKKKITDEFRHRLIFEAIEATEANCGELTESAHIWADEVLANEPNSTYVNSSQPTLTQVNSKQAIEYNKIENNSIGEDKRIYNNSATNNTKHGIRFVNVLFNSNPYDLCEEEDNNLTPLIINGIIDEMNTMVAEGVLNPNDSKLHSAKFSELIEPYMN